MGTIHNLIKRRKSTNLVFQRCENKSSFFRLINVFYFWGRIQNVIMFVKKLIKFVKQNVITESCYDK